MIQADKAFIKKFESKIKSIINKYKLCTKKDRIIVACSGGKDSTTVLYLLKKWGYHVEGLIIDLYIGKWSKQNIDNVQKFCKDQGIKLNIIDMRDMFGCSICFIRSGIQEKINLKNCAICGVIKRWLLNKKSRELKATKLATGHNLDDQAETILMNMIKGNPAKSISQTPKTGIIEDKKFVQRIKPLYFCTNDEVRRYSQLMNFPVLYQPCPCSTDATRRKVRAQIADMENYYPDLKKNIVNNFLKEYVKEYSHIRKQMLKGKQAVESHTMKSESATSNSEKIKYCTICGEPSRNDICQTCKLIMILKK